MSKFFKFFYKGLIAISIMYCLYSIMLIVISWNYEPENRIISNPILSGIEIIVLNSEKELPFESSFKIKEETKAFITFERNRLKIWLFSPKISTKFLCQEIEIIQEGQLSRVKSWLLFVGRYNFYIKDVHPKGNFLDIELGVSGKADTASIVCLMCMAGIGALIFFNKK